ncbi:hypothetical protein ACWDTT_15860 [Streptosporangium sandarakinum]
MKGNTMTAAAIPAAVAARYSGRFTSGRSITVHAAETYSPAPLCRPSDRPGRWSRTFDDREVTCGTCLRKLAKVAALASETAAITVDVIERGKALISTTYADGSDCPGILRREGKRWHGVAGVSDEFRAGGSTLPAAVRALARVMGVTGRASIEWDDRPGYSAAVILPPLVTRPAPVRREPETLELDGRTGPRTFIVVERQPIPGAAALLVKHESTPGTRYAVLILSDIVSTVSVAAWNEQEATARARFVDYVAAARQLADDDAPAAEVTAYDRHRYAREALTAAGYAPHGGAGLSWDVVTADGSRAVTVVATDTGYRVFLTVYGFNTHGTADYREWPPVEVTATRELGPVVAGLLAPNPGGTADPVTDTWAVVDAVGHELTRVQGATIDDARHAVEATGRTGGYGLRRLRLSGLLTS